MTGTATIPPSSTWWGGYGGRGPERRGRELKKLCFPYVFYLSGGGQGAGNLLQVELGSMGTVTGTVTCRRDRDEDRDYTTP